MKNRGLKNRFGNDVRIAWTSWYKCLWCGKSGADCLHHIKSPSSRDYKKGKFNRSALNSCPLHNHSCHLYNPELHKPETEEKLLLKVFDVLGKNGYKLKEIDEDFIKNYIENYEKIIT